MIPLKSRCLIVLAGAAFITPAAKAAEDAGRTNDWTRHFRAGVQLGLNIHADFSTRGLFSVSGSQPGLPGVSGVDHIYDDGYVRVDQTGNAQGYTSYWGYNSASQIGGPSTAQTLTFHSANSFNLPSGNSRASDAPYTGFDLAYGETFAHLGSAGVGWELGFGLLPMAISDNRNLSATFTRTVHQFNAGGIVLPTAPYNGGPSGLGPTISDVATALSPDTAIGTITGSRTLDVTLYDLRLGPTLYWQLHPRVGVSVSGGPAVGLVRGDYRFNETDVFANGGIARNVGRFSKTETVYGGYANALALFRVEEHGEIFAGVQFMSLGDGKFSNAGREARLKLGAGLFFMVGINWPF